MFQKLAMMILEMDVRLVLRVGILVQWRDN